MGIAVIGINHKKAGLKVRERFSFNSEDLNAHYEALKTTLKLQEAFILSTCNRVELYGAGPDTLQVSAALKDYLCGTFQVRPQFLEEYFYCKTDRQSLAHLFKVASGLDSMVIGESQIIGQIKKAYGEALASGAVGAHLHKALQDALRVAKKVRSLTRISRGVTSVSGVVVELIKKEPALENKKVLVIGAGKVGSMTVAKLSALNLGEIIVMNRDKTAAQELKKYRNVRVADMRLLPKEVFGADIVIAATAAPHIVSREMVEALLLVRRKGLLLIDLGVPRNVEETVRQLEKARLYNIDDLAPVIDQTLRNRKLEAEKAEAIIEDELRAQQIIGSEYTADTYLCAR